MEVEIGGSGIESEIFGLAIATPLFGVVFRLFSVLLALALIFLFLYIAVNYLAVNRYTLLDISEEQKVPDIFTEEALSDENGFSDDSESDFNDSIYLNHQQFYQSLNNSQQYLRRDSFTQ